MIEAACVALLLLGAWRAVPWRDGRYLHFAFSFVAFAVFLALGPRAAWLVLVAGAAGTSVHVIASRKGLGPLAVALSLGVTTVATLAAMGAAQGLVVAQHLSYPIPFSTTGTVLRFTGILSCLFVVSALAKEALLRLATGGKAARQTEAVEAGTTTYSLGGVVSAPLHYASHPLYVRGMLALWVGTLAWSFLLNAVVRRELERDDRARRTLRELALKERLSAVGETMARVVHQTRHQLGLIGISAHRIGKRIGSLAGEDAQVVREELDKLNEVQRELSGMLTRDLRDAGDRNGPLPLTYAAAISSVARRLESVAETRGIRLELGSMDSIEDASPIHSENVTHALFNVMENALAAARGVVRVEANPRSGAIVISVLDDGPGLTPAVLERATEPFFTTKVDGTGMGLAIARAAFEEEGAQLTIANRAEGGCHVEIAIPRGVGERETPPERGRRPP